MHYREYVRATGINLLFTFCIFLYLPVIAPYVKSLGFDNFQVGLIFSVFSLVIIFSSSIVGKLADSIGKTRMIILGMIIEVIAMGLYLASPNLVVIVIARILNAISFSAVLLIALAKIEDALTDKERGKYAGISLSIANVGAIVAPVLGGVLADQLFIKAPFILTAILLLIFSFVIVLRTPKTTKKIKKNDFNLFVALKNFVSSDALKASGILGVVMHASTPAMQVFLPLFIFERLGLSYSYIGIALFFFGIAHLFQFYFGTLSDKYGRITMTLFGTFIFALFMFFLSVANSYWLLLVLLFFMGIGGAIWNISAWSLMSDIGEKMNKEGEVIGSYMSIAKVGNFVSFLFSGLIVELFGFEALFITCAFVIAIGMLFASHYFRVYEHFSKKHTKLS